MSSFRGRGLGRLAMVLSVVVALTVVACAPAAPNASQATGQPKRGGTLNWPISGNPIVYPFTQTATVNSWPVMQTIYDVLVVVDPVSFEVKPSLATSWKVLEGGRVWEFELRQGVKWHDGQPFTADDVVFTLKATGNKDYAAFHQLYFADMEKAEAVDASHVRLTFTRPRGNLLPILAYQIFIAPNHIFKNLAPKDAATESVKHPIGTGPFKFSENVAGDHYTVVANDDYFAGRPYLDSVLFKVIPDTQAQIAQFQAGTIDWVQPTSDAFNALKGRAGIQTVQFTANLLVLVALNNALPLFSDARVRRALAMALDREGIVKSVLSGNGRAAVGPIIPVFKWAYPEDVKPLAYDPQAARRLLSEAGWSDSDNDGVLDKAGTPFRFTMVHWQSQYRGVLDVAQQQWKQVGVDAKIEILDSAAAIGKYRSRQYEAAMTWWTPPFDPDMANYFGTKGVNNVYNFTNPDDELLAKASAIVDLKERAALYKTFQQNMREAQPAVFLFYPDDLQAHWTRVHGLQPESGVVTITRGFNVVWKE